MAIDALDLNDEVQNVSGDTQRLADETLYLNNEVRKLDCETSSFTHVGWNLMVEDRHLNADSWIAIVEVVQPQS